MRIRDFLTWDCLLHMLGAGALQLLGTIPLYLLAHIPMWRAAAIVAGLNVAFWFFREVWQADGRIARDNQAWSVVLLWRRINHPEYLCVVPVGVGGVILAFVA